MSMNRNDVKSWSVDWIKFKLDVLYKKLLHLREDKGSYLDLYERKLSDPLKESHHDPNAYNKPIMDVKSDIELLKNLIRIRLDLAYWEKHPVLGRIARNISFK